MSLDQPIAPSDIRPPSTRRLKTAGIVAALVIIAIVASGYLSRSRDDARVKAWTADQALPSVAVATPGDSGKAPALSLPGRLEAWARASLYARVSGYLKSWKVDIGEPVKAGQLLAEIEAPDIDQQLLQARADLATAQANADLAQTTAKRWQSLVQHNAVSRQEAEEKSGDLAARQAQVKAAQANVERLEALSSFKRIVAPFAGVVTARATDVGALINAGGGGPELFEISDTRRLRVYVNVPQSYMSAVKPGAKAAVTVPEHPGQRFPATIMASAQAVDASTGTTLIQLQVNNPDGLLLPGGFAYVDIALPAAATLQIPASALIYDKDGLRVAVADADNRVQFKTIAIERDLGSTLAVGAGLDATDRVIVNPPDGIAEGDAVRVVETPAKARP